MSSEQTSYFVGVDGCKAGWLTVALTKECCFEINVFADVSALWKKHSSASIILIDIPIGLKDAGFHERRCDIEARKLLGRSRRSSVFRAPCRVAIYTKTYKKACCINERRTGKRLSRQTWNIIPKICEVDNLLSKDESARSRIRETHPELCFWALAGGHAMKHKKSIRKGFEERKQLLQSIYPHTDKIVNYALETYRRNQVEEDDILDALAAAVTAKLGFQRGFMSIPRLPEFDLKGLRMEMVYLSRD